MFFKCRANYPPPPPPPSLCGYPPFYDESDAVLFEMIMKGKFEFDERYWKDISKEAKHLISCMLQVDPVKRYDTYQILQHPWITGKVELPNVNLSRSISMNLKSFELVGSKASGTDLKGEKKDDTTTAAGAATTATAAAAEAAKKGARVLDTLPEGRKTAV